MCGLLFYLCNCDFNFTEIRNRGPDKYKKVVKKNIASFIGCVLHHQGANITEQPLIYRDSLLLWNGENYDNEYGNDGEELLKIIEELNDIDAINAIAAINGPFATIYYNNDSSMIYFGRDFLGRRSLICGVNSSNNIITLSSVIVDGCNHVGKWIELPALGIYSSIITEDNCLSKVCLYLYNFYSIEYAIEELLKVGLSDIEIMSHTLNTQNERRIIHDNIPVETLLTVLDKSTHRRVNNVHGQCSDCLRTIGFVSDTDCRHSKVAILFSGGVDSAVIAALADRFIHPEDSIDLLNVAFYSGVNDTNEIADRITGLACLEELMAINPSRKWNFVEIDVYPEELKAERTNRIAKLIQPCDSVLDDSIGCALWFAARGRGKLRRDNSEYVSPARVVLTGIGADELMAGYSRHRVIFEKYGYDKLEEELNMELKRIASRNMGRDDRVLSCHGREGRFPFLDKDVVSFLQSLPVSLKCDLTKERGVGKKMILRVLAKEYLQLTYSSQNLKRAIQFGSRIAKIDRLSKGAKASQKCDRLDI